MESDDDDDLDPYMVGGPFRHTEHPRRRSRSMSRPSGEFSGLGHHMPFQSPTTHGLEQSLVQMGSQRLGRAPSRTGVLPPSHSLHGSHVGQYLGPHLSHGGQHYQGATHTRTYMPGILPGQMSTTSSYVAHRGGQPHQLIPGYAQMPYRQQPTQIMLSTHGEPVHYVQIGGNGLSSHHQQMYGGPGATYATRVSLG